MPKVLCSVVFIKAECQQERYNQGGCELSGSFSSLYLSKDSQNSNKATKNFEQSRRQARLSSKSAAPASYENRISDCKLYL